MAIVTIIAIVVSPLVAVLVTMWLQNRKEKRHAKLWIFNTLIATRHFIAPTDEKVRALNTIDVAFHDAPRVRQTWHELFDMLNNAGLQNPLGYQQRQKKTLELITEMAKALGYGKAITHLDVDRVYSPIGLGVQSERSEAIADELLRVLKASGGVAVTPRADDGAPKQITGAVV